MFLKIIEEMTDVDWLIFTTTSFSYFFIYLAVRKNKGRGQSFFTWVMWLVLDVILLIPTIKEDGQSSLMLGASIIGSFSISIFLLKLKKVEWSWSEWMSFSLIVLMILIWFLSSNNNIVIACRVISQVIAGLPLTMKSWQEPEPGYILGYSFFILGCIFLLTLENNAFKSFSLENHLFPVALGLQTVIELIPLVLKFFSKK